MENQVDHVNVVDGQYILLVFLIWGFLLGWIFPVRFFPTIPGYIVGVIIVAIALSIGGSALLAMRKARTSPNTNRPTAVLVDSGVFRYSRNPIYLSMFLLYLGIAVFVNVIWFLLFFPIFFLLVDKLVVPREEKYLERRFGDDYRRYRARVRRWV